MMAGYCLPRNLVQKFQDAVDNGFLKPNNLAKLSSGDRFERIAKIVGEDNASQVNALFEKGLLFERRQLGFNNWVRQVSGQMSEKARENVVDKINGLDERILNPYFEKNFLADLAAEKLGAKVSVEDAKAIFDLAKKAKDAKSDWEKDLSTKVGYRETSNPLYQTRINYGESIRQLQDKIDDFKPSGRTWKSIVLNGLLIPKTLATGIFHLSAFGVQAWGMLGRTATYEAFGHQFKYLWDEKHYNELMDYITSHPDYKHAKDAGLGLVDVSDQLSTREEAIQSSLLQSLNTYVAERGGQALNLDKPLPINIVGASSRAFTGFLNYQRFTVFTQLLEQARRTDPNFLDYKNDEGESVVLNNLASAVNNFSGRGKLGPAEGMHKMQQFLNATFFAPRKVTATFQMFNPQFYGSMYLDAYRTKNYTAANAAVQNLVSSLIITGTITGAAKAFGYTVNYDPTSQDFMKVEHGKEKYDITGGNAIWVRTLGRLFADRELTARNKEIELNGSGFRPVTRGDLVSRYISGKLSPAAGIMLDAFNGTDAVGNDFSVSKEVRDRFEPIFMSSIMSYYHQNPEKSVYDLPILASMFGIQAESPTPPLIKKGMTVWGEPMSLLSDPVRSDFENKLDTTGYIPNFPGDTIKSVKLTDQQYKQYIQMSGSIARARLDNLLNSPSFNTARPEIQRLEIKKFVEGARKQTQGIIEAQSKGTDNDIVDKSIKNLKAQYGVDEDQSHPASLQDKASLKTTLSQPVNSPEDMKKQWADLMVKDYDFGKMVNTNPLAYLGYQAVKNQGVASYSQTPTTALGTTFTANHPENDFRDDPESRKLMLQTMKEAKIDPDSAKGHIMLGPQFGEGKNTYTLEHELMHRGIMELIKSGFQPKIGDHLMIYSNEHLHGTDGHSKELEEDLMANAVKPQFKNDEAVHKEFASIYSEDIDKIQDAARHLIKGNK